MDEHGDHRAGPDGEMRVDISPEQSLKRAPLIVAKRFPEALTVDILTAIRKPRRTGAFASEPGELAGEPAKHRKHRGESVVPAILRGQAPGRGSRPSRKLRSCVGRQRDIRDRSRNYPL